MYVCRVCGHAESYRDEMGSHILAQHCRMEQPRVLAGLWREVPAYEELIQCESCTFKHWTAEDMMDHVDMRHTAVQATVLSGAELLRLSRSVGAVSISDEDSASPTEVTPEEVTRIWNWSPETDNMNDRIDLALAQQAAAGARKRHPASDSSGEGAVRRQVRARIWSDVARAVDQGTQSNPSPRQAVVGTQVVMNPGLFTAFPHEINLKCDVFQESDQVRGCNCTKWVASMYFNCELPTGKICRYGSSMVNFTGKFCAYGHPGSRHAHTRPCEPQIDDDAVYRGEVMRVKGIFEVEFVLAMRSPPVRGSWYVWDGKILLGTVVIRDQQLPIFSI